MRGELFMKAMQEIQRIVSHHHEVAKEWKTKTGGKVFGYLSHDIPEELIYAAGVLPVRILGSHEPEVITDPYMWNMMHRVFERDCLAQGLQGRYSYLDGIIGVARDPHICQCFFSWTQHIPIPYSYEFQTAVVLGGRRVVDYLRGEVEDFKQSLEAWTGKPISDKSIDHAIEVYNQTRRLVKQISEFRKDDVPKITGAEFMEIALAGMLTDKAEYNHLLEQLVKDIPKRKIPDGQGVRVMLIGGANDHIDLVKAIEGMGVQVVVDDYSTGGRYYVTEVIPEADRLHALAVRMVNKPRSPLADLPERTRPAYLLNLAREYKVQGSIFMIQRGDDAEEFDYPANRKPLEDNNIPTLVLELDFTNPVEQFRTRVEAFMETLES
jgi:benzoyl-CoA reductase subunit C